jgi:hypothetical protein
MERVSGDERDGDDGGPSFLREEQSREVKEETEGMKEDFVDCVDKRG